MKRYSAKAAMLALACLVLPLLGAGTASAAHVVELRNGMNDKCLETLSFDNSNGAWAGLWDCWGGATNAGTGMARKSGTP